MAVIDKHMKYLEPNQCEALERIRVIVHPTVPDTEEVITTGMSGFKYRKKYLKGFAAFKDHLSIFPVAGPIEVSKDRPGEFELSKGTI